ncbi:chorismate mutase, putative [Pseudomonas sp. GM21]|jgi:chorismate mutase|uniref:chorismate mutase n=1 Tax=Pseudomonas TaxID=286 RepID=UPI000272422D|nr:MULTISPECIES: chorismate mutase [Pseudomonas]EJM13977.1 chorismate mutase, putative [Pseudomonas sp. GM21]MDR6926970.1 chorismate mutase [Pseudomonas sp. BE134]MDR7284978.1 chorismate mutase [Pseudomonas corrugata]
MPHFQRLPQLLSCALFGVFACSVQASTPAPVPDSLLPLLVTINERLNTADLVALTKWDSGKPVQDTARETQLIDNARKTAVSQKLNPDEVADLIAAQIEANKLVQYGLLAQWRAADKAPDTPRPDLIHQIRPLLDELQHRLLQQYAAFEPYRNDPHCPDWLGTERASLIKDQLHGQALIRATGELCVIAP